MSHPIFAMTFLSECDYFSLVSNWWLLQEFEKIRNVLQQLVEKSIISFSRKYIIHMNCTHHLDISIRNINLMLLMILCHMNYFPSFLGKFLLVVTQNASHTKLKNQYLKNDVLKLLLHLAENRSKSSFSLHLWKKMYFCLTLSFPRTFLRLIVSPKCYLQFSPHF